MRSTIDKAGRLVIPKVLRDSIGSGAIASTQAMASDTGSALRLRALRRGQRLDDDRPVRGGQPGEIIGIGGLDHAAARFDRHRDGMGVCEKRGTRTRLSKKSPDEASQGAIGVAEQQPIPRFPGEERVQGLITSGSPVQLGKGSRRDRDLAAQPARRFHGTPDLSLRRMPRIKQGVHCLGI
jgi:hypothetical protein